MRDDDQQVDFVIDDGVVPDLGEDLPGAFGGSPRSRLRLVVGGLVAVLIVAALIVRASSRHDTPSAHASPSTSTTATVSDADRTPAIVAHPAAYPKTCPLDERSRSLCLNAIALPRPVVAALRAGFPGARIGSSKEEELRDIGFGSGMLYYRELHAHAGSRKIDIEVHPLTDTDHALTITTSTSIIVQRLTPAVFVRIVVTVPAGARLPDVDMLGRLASDDRLAIRG